MIKLPSHLLKTPGLTLRLATAMLTLLLAAAPVFSQGNAQSGVHAPAQSSTAPKLTGKPAQTGAGAAIHAFDPSLRDTALDPCTDFYAYACGGWLRTHPIPPDRSSYGRDTEAEDADEQVLRAILERAAGAAQAAGKAVSIGQGSPARTANEQKIGDAYAACMDTDAINAAGIAPLRRKLDALALQSKADLPDLLARLQLDGVASLFWFGAQQDARHATEEIAAVGQPRLGLPEKGYYDRADARSSTLRSEYAAHIERTFALLGEPAGDAMRDANAVLRLETAMAAASLAPVELRDPTRTYHRMPLVQFSANSPELQAARYLKTLGAPPLQSLNVMEPVYFLSLHELLDAATLPELQALLRWDVVRAVPGTALPQPLDDENFDFYGKTLEGTPQQMPRWKRCAETVDRELGEALGQLYVAERFSPEDKQRTEAMTRTIEAAAGRAIAALDWMSAPTKAEAEAKLRLLANNIGYPDRWRDYSALPIERVVPGNTASGNAAFDNAEQAARFEAARNLHKIGQSVDRSEWTMTPPTVNAYYNPQMNSINFPAGILQPPYYDPSEDDAVNYGAIGGVIGHELTHGFDDEGRLFDGRGNLRDWWRKEDARQFADRAACVTSEYNGFVQIDELHVDGKLTLGEDLADLSGLQLAFLAYTAKAKEAGTAQDAAGGAASGGLTPAQQFFTAYGQSWCENTRPDAMRQRVAIDPHAPEKYRVNGVVQNMPVFAEAFGCKAGAPMVAAKRCTVW